MSKLGVDLTIAFRSLVQARKALVTGGASRTDRVHANLAKLRRIVGDLRSGLISTTTLSPGLSVARVHPRRTRLPGLVDSSAQITGSSPSLMVPFTHRLTCGLTQRTSVTTPLIVSVLE